MKAVKFDSYGDTSVLEIRDVATPEPAGGEVLVRVIAAGINPGEIGIRSGQMRNQFPATFPEGQGSDFAGEVVRLGDGVRSLSVGDGVIGMSDGRNAQAEYVAIDARRLVPKPTHLQWDTAATLNVSGTTAQAMVEAVRPEKGETLVVSGAAGAVGLLTCQLARRRGARVIGIASDANAALLRGTGVEPIAYGDGLVDRLRALAGGSGVDAFADCYGPDYVAVATALGVPTARINSIKDFEGAKRFGVTTRGHMDVGDPAAAVASLARQIADGELFLPIRSSFPLDQVREAYDELAKGHGSGKIVLRVRERAV